MGIFIAPPKLARSVKEGCPCGVCGIVWWVAEAKDTLTKSYGPTCKIGATAGTPLAFTKNSM
jgi:hypothetical protein